MAIGVVIPRVPGYSETFFSSLFRSLLESGIKVVLFTNRGSATSYPGIRVVRGISLPQNQLFRFLKTAYVVFYTFMINPIRCSKLALLLRADGGTWRAIIERIVISAHIIPWSMEWIYFAYATQAVGREMIARAIGAKLAISLRGFDAFLYPLQNAGIYTKLWPNVDRLHYLSDALFNEAQDLGAPRSISGQKIPPAVDTEFFYCPDRSLKMGSPLKILTVARLHWVKGLNYAIQAVKYLKDSGVEVTYTIIGEGEEYERLCCLVNKLDLNDHVQFMGSRSPADVRSYMHSSDIFLMPSTTEGFCNAVLEAQASGIRCLVSNAGGLPENVLNGKTGWVVPRRSAKAISDGVIALVNLGSKETETVLSEARKRVVREFSLPIYERKWQVFFSD